MYKKFKFSLISFNLSAFHIIISHSAITTNFAVEVLNKTKIHCNINTTCPHEYNPICTFNGINYRLFSNNCLLKATNACEEQQQQRWQKINEILPCLILPNKKCSNTFIPVCGFNNDKYALFVNECYLNQQNQLDSNKWQKKENLLLCVKNATKENEQIKDTSSSYCPDTFNPICGFNGINYLLFDNICHFNNRNLLDNNKWKRENNLLRCLLVKDENNENSSGNFENFKQYQNDGVTNFNTERKCNEFQPICARYNENYQIFTNECEFEKENNISEIKWIKVDDFLNCGRKVVDQLEQKCPFICPSIFGPICGTDGLHYKLFSNECLMKSESCLSNREWRPTNNKELCN